MLHKVSVVIRTTKVKASGFLILVFLFFLSASSNAQLKEDITPPETALSFSKDPHISGNNIFISTDTYVILSSTDPEVEGDSTSGVDFTAYLIDVSPEDCGEMQAPVSTAPAGTCENYVYSEPFVLSAGTHTIYYLAFDNAGNEEAVNIASITATGFSSLSGDISITPSLPQGSTVTIIVSTGSLDNKSIMAFPLEAEGEILSYNIVLPAPATYFVLAIAGVLSENGPPPDVPIGVYNNYAPVYMDPDVAVSNIDFDIEPDYELPVSSITSIIDGSTLTVLNSISGTASDNIGVDYMEGAAEDITTDLWWIQGAWVSTDTIPPFGHAEAVFQGPPNAVNYTLDTTTNAYGSLGWLSTHLAKGNEYKIHLRAGDFSGNLSSPVSASFIWDGPQGEVAPHPPDNLTDFVLGISSISWTWDAVQSADGYAVYSDTGVFLSSVTEPSFISTAAAANSQLSICVGAYNVYGEAGRSCGAAYTLANIPGTPIISNVALDAFTVAWSTAGNTIGTFFELSGSTDNFQSEVSTSVIIPSGSGDIVSVNIPNLEPDTTYYVKIRAINGDNIPSGFSAVVSTKTLMPPPYPPINLTAIFDASLKTVSVFWSSASSGTPAVSFNVYGAKDPEPDFFNLLMGGTTNLYYEDSITDSSTYYYRITANNADGLEGEASEILPIETDIIAPGTVSDLKISSALAETGQITLTWTAPSENIKLGYYVIKTSASPLGYDDWENAVFVATVPASVLTGNQESFETIVDSTSSIKYFALKAFDSYDNISTLSNSAIFDLIIPTVSFTSSIEPDSTVSRPFSIQIESSDNNILSKIQILADGVVIDETVVGAYSYSGSFIWNIADYDDGYHIFSVKAFDAFGNTAEKELPVLISYSPPATPAITFPEDGFALSTSTIVVAGNSEPGVYISIFVNNDFTASAEVSSSGDFSISDVPLGGDGAISITAQAVDSKGSSPHSTAVSGVVDTGPPNSPKNLSADSLSGGEIKFIWTLPEGEIPASYKVYRSTEETALIAEESPDPALLIADNITALEYSDFPSQDDIYYYGIISVDAAGNESFLSNIAYGLSDSLAPTASVSLSSAPPLGAGDYRLELTVSEILSAAPFITFTPFGQYPIQINSEPSSPYLWIGTFTVTQAMASGEGKFAFQGVDLSNNAGETITAGNTLLLETEGPVASISFDSLNSYLKAGEHTFKINLDKPAISNPSLFFSTNSVDNIPVYVSSSTDASIWSGAITVNADIGEGPANFFYSAYDSLGNKGVLIEGTTFFTIDTITLGAPVSLNGSVGSSGLINLSWSAPSGESPSTYCVYRDSEQISCSIIPNSDGTGSFSETLAEGTYDYYVTALDKAKNESAPSNSVEIAADSIAPAPSTITDISLNETIGIDLVWTSEAEAISFRLYRSTFSGASIEGAPYRIVLGSSAIDTPELDGIYFYALTALDAAGNESAVSNELSITYDIAAPIISVSGISNGIHYNGDVAPVFEAYDINLDTSSLKAQLNGLPFISGSTISAQGDYILNVESSDTLNHFSSKTVNFTIDKTSPTLSVSGISSGGYYEQSVLPLVSAEDINFSNVSALLNSQPFIIGSTISLSGSYILQVSAFDLAGNSALSQFSFTVDLPSQKPANVSAIIENGSAVKLIWEKPQADVALYKIFKDGVYLGPVNTDQNTFRDTSYSSDINHIYEIAVIDSKGREGEKATVEIIPVSFNLAGYGTFSSASNSEALNRGFFDSVRLNIINKSAQEILAGPFELKIDSASALSQAVSVGALSSIETSAAVFVSTSLADTVSASVVLTLPVAGDAISLTAVKTFTLNVRNPLWPIVEIFPEPLIKGAYSKVKVKFNNRGSAPIDIITGKVSGSETLPSPSIAIELKTQEGFTLSRGEILQTSNGANIALLNGEQIYFVRVNPGSSFMFDPLNVAVPESADSLLNIFTKISNPLYSIGFNPVASSVSFENTRSQSCGGSVPYTVSASPARQIYDKGEEIIFTGSAIDSYSLLPVKNVPVLISMVNKGYERFITTTTISDGSFTAVFQPAAEESGTYFISASHPKSISRIAQSSFSIIGMEFGYNKYEATLAQNSDFTFNIPIINSGEVSISAIEVSFESVSGSGVTMTGLNIPSGLEAGIKHDISVKAAASSSASSDSQFLLKVSESNGFERTMPIYIKAVPAQVIPKITPQIIEIGMLAGEVREENLIIENIGFSTWTGVYLGVPTLDWVKIITSTDIGDIAPGENVNIKLGFEPPAMLSNGSYVQNPLIKIMSSSNDFVPLNASIVITSLRKGNANFTIASADIPSDNPTGRLNGADIRLTSLDISGMSLNAKTDLNGLARFEDIPAGKYAWRAETDGYNPESGIIKIEPGITKDMPVFLPTTMVTYKWSVTPTTIIDKYDITLDMTFRTDVPAPALIIDPPVISLNMQGGEVAYAQYTLKNKGLVSAFDLDLTNLGDSSLTIESPISKIDELKPNQSVVIPLKISLAHASSHSGECCANGNYFSQCGLVPTGVCIRIVAGDVTSSGGIARSGRSDGGGGFTVVGPVSFVAAAVSRPAPVETCIDSGEGPALLKYSNGGPNPCGTGADAGSGNVKENIPGGRNLGKSSLGIDYSLEYNSLKGGLSDFSGVSVVEVDGNMIMTLEDGTKILLVPIGSLNPEITGSGPQFENVPGFSGSFVYSGGQYTFTEKDGTVTEFTDINGIYRPKVKRDRNNTTLTYDYNVNGKLEKITDIHGRNISLNYNADDNLESISDFANRTASYVYDSTGNLTQVTDLDGSQTNYTYTDNMLTGITYPNGGHKYIVYDSTGRAISITEDLDNNKQTFVYNDVSLQTVMTDALGRQTVYDYINVEGRKEITKITAPDGSITSFGYDENLNRIFVQDALNRKTSMSYNDESDLIGISDAFNNLTQMTYEENFHQVTSVTDAKGNITKMGYDASGNLVQIQDALSNTSYMNYDAMGHVKQTKDPLGNVSNFEYDNNGALIKVTDPLGRLTQMPRNNLSRVTQTTDPKNKLTLFDYDIMGNLTKVTDAKGGITEYTYTGGCPTCGGGDLLESVKDAKNQTTSFSYDLQKRLTNTTNPLSQSKNFVYDKKGNLTSVTDAKGQTITFEYDTMDRLTVKHLPEGDVNYSYDAVGNLTVVAELALQTRNEFTYDKLNRVVSVAQTLNSQLYTLNYAYDINGNRTSMSTPWGNYNYSYDNLNRLISVTSPESPGSSTVHFEYDVLGRRKKMSLPNGTETTYAYDNASQLTQILHRKVSDNSAITYSNYSYDLAGNRTNMTDIIGSHNYNYDDLHRLTSAEHPALSSVETKEETFNYDTVGNRLSDANVTGYNYDSANRLLSNSSYTYTYDNNGNLVSKTSLQSPNPRTDYVYNSENQLIEINLPDGSKVNYSYDPLGRRIEKSVLTSDLLLLTSRFIYDNEDIIAVLDKDNNVVNTFTHGPGIDEPLIMKKGTDNYYYHADGLGSIIALSDNNASIVETYEYQAYGKPVIKDNQGTVFDKSTVDNPYLYTAREYDDTTGLFYYRARYYSSETGRFLQEDPIGFLGGDVNLYSYVQNKPINKIDPQGLKSVESANCAALKKLIQLDSVRGKIGVLFSWKYNSGSLSPDIVNLNASFDSIYGPVDVDWMLRSALFGAGALPPISLGAYGNAKITWNIINSIKTKTLQSPFVGMDDIGHINAPYVASLWLWSNKGLGEIFAPAIEQCRCIK